MSIERGNRMSKFIEFGERTYYRGGHVTTDMCVSLDDIARIVTCVDDYSLTNLITKDGKVHTLNERYADVVKKIKQAEGGV